MRERAPCPGRHDEKAHNPRGHAPVPPIPNHAVASLGVGPGLGGVPRRYVVELLLHLRRRDVKDTLGVLEHGLHGVVPWGELATALQPPGVCVSRGPSSGRPRLGPPVVGRRRRRGTRQLSPLGHGRVERQAAQVEGVGRGPDRCQAKAIPPALLRPLQGRAVRGQASPVGAGEKPTRSRMGKQTPAARPGPQTTP